jgi:hypothetical protein
MSMLTEDEFHAELEKGRLLSDGLETGSHRPT